MKYIAMFIFVLFLFGCNKSDNNEIKREDKSTVIFCGNPDCKKLIVFKSNEDFASCVSTGNETCEKMKNVLIVDKNHPDYEFYFLKWQVCQSNNRIKDFNKFYKWYLANKDKEFEIVISETEFKSTCPIETDYIVDNSTYTLKPVYEKRNRKVPYHIGRTLTYREEEYTALTGFEYVKNEKSIKIPVGTTFCKVKVTRKIDAVTYYKEYMQ